jgi:hypothetical protein
VRRRRLGLDLHLLRVSAGQDPDAFGFRFRRFDHLGDQLLLAQLSGTLGQFGAHRQHLALSLGFGQGAWPGRSKATHRSAS